MKRPEVILGGEHLSGVTKWGDLEWSTCWPGGTESITFDVDRRPRTLRPDTLVELVSGGILIASGMLGDTPRGEPLRAEGLWRKGEDYAALVGAGVPAADINQAVDAAIGFRGLPWIRTTDADLAPSLSPPNPMPALDPDQVHTISQFMDAAAKERKTQWGVLPSRHVVYSEWETTPSLHMLPGVEGLGISRDGYASTLYARYLDSTTSTYETVMSEDLAAEARWGYAEHTLTAPLGDGIAMTEARAQDILDGIMKAGASKIGWTKPLEVSSGDVVNAYGRAVDLNRIHARQTGRLHGLSSDLADLNGGTTADLRIARTRHSGSTVEIEQVGLSSPMADALAGMS